MPLIQTSASSSKPATIAACHEAALNAADVFQPVLGAAVVTC
jgi:hypothetical protein